MFFDLVNASATFQTHINKILKSFVDVFCIVYFDDVLIYSNLKKKHWKYVRKILIVLLKHKLYAKFNKCIFNCEKIIFFEFIITFQNIKIKKTRINTITEWSEFEFVKNILMFLEFAEFYWRFIAKFFIIIVFWQIWQRTWKKKEFKPHFTMIEKTRKAFKQLKIVFITTSVLQHFDWKTLFRMKTDSFKQKMTEILIQFDVNGQWHSIAYYNYKFKDSEINWNTYDQKMYIIILEFKTWRHYLQNSKHFVCMIINYKNLHFFMIIKKFNDKQMRWTEKLTAFDFHIKYHKNKLNPADESSKKSDIMKSELNEKNVFILFILQNKLHFAEYQSELQKKNGISATVRLIMSMIQLNNTIIANTWTARLNEKTFDKHYAILNSMTFRFLINQIMKSKKSYLDSHEFMIAWLFKLQQKNVFVVNEQWRHVFSKNKIKLSKWNIDKNDLLHRTLTAYVPKNAVIINEILHKNHDDSNAKHFFEKCTKKAIKKYYWFDIIKQIVEYVCICFVYQRMHIHHHKFYDFLKSIFFDDEKSFTMMTMNFIINLSSAKDSYTKKTNDFILMFINKFIKFTTYVATIKTLNAKRLTDLLWREFICHYDMMHVIIFDQKFLFTSKFWKILCWFLSMKRKFNIAFHSQTDEQIEK